MWTKLLSISLSILLFFHIGCASFSGIQRQFQIGSKTFNRGEWIIVEYTDNNGDLYVEKGRLEKITEGEIILQGPPPKRIVLDRVKRIDRFIDEGSLSERRISPRFSSRNGLILAGLFIGALFMIYVIFPPQFDSVGKSHVGMKKSGLMQQDYIDVPFLSEVATPQKPKNLKNLKNQENRVIPY